MEKPFSNERERLKYIRSLHPNAYALSANEALQIQRIYKIIIEFFITHEEFTQITPPDKDHLMSRVSNVYNQESVILIKEMLKNKRIRLDNAYNIADRVLNGKWFEVYAAYGSLDAKEYTHLAYITSDKPNTLIKADREQYTELYEVWDKPIKTESNDKEWNEVIAYYDCNPEGLRDALSLGNDYLYLDWRERSNLELIKFIYEFEFEAFTQDQTNERFLQMPNTNGTTALTTIGKRALKNTHFDDPNEIYIIPTDQARITMSINGKSTKEIDGKRFVNMDKLFRLILNKAHKEGYKSKYITITLEEYKMIGGKDNKEARKQLKKAADDLYNLSLIYKFGNEKNQITISTRVLEAKAEIKNSSITFCLADNLYNNLKTNKSISYIPYELLCISSRSENAYKIGVFLRDHQRRNIGKDNENRVSISKLLEVTSLPLAEDIKPNRYKLQIIDPFFKALNTAASTGVFSYKIVHSKGKPLTDKEAINVYFDYELFISCLVDITWLTELDPYAQIRERKLNNQVKSKRKGSAK